jgi:hypothetical protein
MARTRTRLLLGCLGEALTGSACSALATLEAAPGGAAVANALSAFALTRAYARWADAACAHPERARAPSPRSFADS